MPLFSRLYLAAVAVVTMITAATAADYPTRPIRMIVPYPAGGATDVVARIVAAKMSDALGQQIVVDNRAGAGTMIGASAVARSDADGYTILMGDSGTYAFNPTLYGKRLTYDRRRISHLSDASAASRSSSSRIPRPSPPTR